MVPGFFLFRRGYAALVKIVSYIFSSYDAEIAVVLVHAELIQHISGHRALAFHGNSAIL